MEFLKFDINKCVLCGVCVEKCPFGALTIEGNGIVVGDACRMCGLCVRNCPEKAIRFERNPLTRINGKTFLSMWSRREERSIRLPLS